MGASQINNLRPQEGGDKSLDYEAVVKAEMGLRLFTATAAKTAGCRFGSGASVLNVAPLASRIPTFSFWARSGSIIMFI